MTDKPYTPASEPPAVPAGHLGTFLGGLAYLGSCRVCGAQFMSTHEWVYLHGTQILCRRCHEKPGNALTKQT